MTGLVSADLEAELSLRIRDAAGTFADIQSVLDTGFNGFLTVTPELANKLGLPIRGHVDAQLGDGRTVRMPLREARVQRFSGDKEIPVLTSDAGVLVGMGLLRGCRVEIDVEVQGMLRLSAL